MATRRIARLCTPLRYPRCTSVHANSSRLPSAVVEACMYELPLTGARISKARLFDSATRSGARRIAVAGATPVHCQAADRLAHDQDVACCSVSSAQMVSIKVSLDLKGTSWNTNVSASGSMKEAVMSAKQQSMERINQYMAQNKQDPVAAEEVNVMEEEVPDDVDDGDDEIQQLAGEASHKPKKRKTGL